MNNLYDLIEYRYSPSIKKMVKYQTHKTNIPKTLAYGLKMQYVAQRKSQKLNPALYRFKIVKNGSKQYSNNMKK
jgi:hypothetical protein